MPQYKVQAGDTLSKIARQFGTTISNISGYRSGNPNLIYPGEVLTINTPSSTPATSQSPQFTPAKGIGSTYTDSSGTTWRFNERGQWEQISQGIGTKTPAPLPSYTPPSDYSPTPSPTPIPSPTPQPESTSATGNDILDNMLKGFQDVIDSLLDTGKIVNPKVDITPDLIQKWADQASQELDPYYQSQYQTIKSDLSSDLAYLSDQYTSSVKAKEEQFVRDLATQREAEAGRGTIFSGERFTREGELAQATERSIQDLTSELGYKGGKLGTEAERKIGSAGLAGLSTRSFSPYSVSTLSKGGFIPLESRTLFTPSGGITGSLEREAIEKKRAYQDLLKSAYLGEQTV